MVYTTAEDAKGVRNLDRVINPDEVNNPDRIDNSDGVNNPDGVSNPDGVNNPDRDRVRPSIGTPNNSISEINRNKDDNAHIKLNSANKIPQVTPNHEDLKTSPKTGGGNPIPTQNKVKNSNLEIHKNMDYNDQNESYFMMEIIYDTKYSNLGYSIMNIKYDKNENRYNSSMNFIKNNLSRLIYDNISIYENYGIFIMPSIILFWQWLLCSHSHISSDDEHLLDTSDLDDYDINADRNKGINKDNYDEIDNNRDSDIKEQDGDNTRKSMKNWKKKLEKSFLGFQWLEGVKNPYGDPDTDEFEKSDYDDNENGGNDYNILLENLKDNSKFDENYDVYDGKNIQDKDDNYKNKEKFNSDKINELKIFSNLHEENYDRYTYIYSYMYIVL
jgi:hypothetical protein